MTGRRPAAEPGAGPAVGIDGYRGGWVAARLVDSGLTWATAPVDRIDLLVEVPQDIEDPAVMSARLASRISRSMGGRQVDVVLAAPNLKPQAIHQIARQTGVLL